MCTWALVASVYICQRRLLPANTAPTQTPTHIPLAFKRRGSLDYVGSEGWRGKTKLILKQLRAKHRTRGKLQEGVKGGRGGVKNHRPQGSSPAAVCCRNAHSHTHTHTGTHKHTQTQTNQCHGWPNRARLISCQSLCTSRPEGGARGEKAREMDEETLVKLQPSIIEPHKLLCPMAPRHAAKNNTKSRHTRLLPPLINPFHTAFIFSFFFMRGSSDASLFG